MKWETKNSIKYFIYLIYHVSLIRLKHFSSYQNVVGREIFKVKGGDVIISSVGFDLFHLSFVSHLNQYQFSKQDQICYKFF